MNKTFFFKSSLLLLLFTMFNSWSQNTNNEKLNTDLKLPDLLISNKGQAIKTTEDWQKIRRPEILKLFEKYVYGKFPKANIKTSFILSKTDSHALKEKAIQKNITVYFVKGKDSVAMELLVFIPKNATKPVPLFLGMNFWGNQAIHPTDEIPMNKSYILKKVEYNIFSNTATEETRGADYSSWPLERILDRGYGVATFCYGDIDPDFDDGFKNGVHSLLNESDKTDSKSISSISAWAFGLSSAMDYLENDPQINKNQIAVFGHSRLGKSALWAGAIDPRFALVVSNESGCGGAALSRGKAGETIKDINTAFPHWFCKNFHTFNDRENELPIDQHMLISLIAPRPVYIGSAELDTWADPKGEFLSLYNASPVYKLFGFNTIEKDSLPAINAPLIVGKTAYHIRTGYHQMSRYDWERYMDFADAQFIIKKDND